MSANEANLGADNTAIAVVTPTLSPEDSWITSLGINDPIDGTPLPTDAGADADQSAAGAGIEPASVVLDDPLGAGIDKPIAAADPAAVEPAVGADADLQLSPVEKKVLSEIPEAERPAATRGFRNRYFMDRFLDFDKPMVEVRDHLKERSAVRYGQLRDTIVGEVFAEPDPALKALFESDPTQYGKLAMAVYLGDPASFVNFVTGRKDVTPAQIREALDFQALNKDKVFEAAPADGLISESQYEDLTTYFPDVAPKIKSALAENGTLREQLAAVNTKIQSLEAAASKPAPAVAEPAKADDADQELTQQRQQLWDDGRDAVVNFVAKIATSATKGAGITATADERTKAPRVALLKDIKGDILWNGLESDGKLLLPDFHVGFTTWGKDRQEMSKVLIDASRYVDALEKENVIAQAEKLFPFAALYYEDRLKNPVFALVDELIEIATKAGNKPVQFDTHVPATVPTTKAQPGAADSDWIVRDAIARSAQ
jgi:hypothetical protein